VIDIHMHPCALTNRSVYEHFRQTGKIPADVLAPFWEAVSMAERAVVLALWAPAGGIEVSNEFVAEVVRQDPVRLVGFASVDPTSEDAIPQLETAVHQLGMRGVKLAPIYQHVAAADPRAWPVYAWIQDAGLPIMWHQGTSALAPDGDLEEAMPHRLDAVARAFPDIKMVIAHFGYPWSGEVVAMLRKHRQLYTDVSVLAGRPWFLYNAMIAALEYGVQDKILLGSDYPGIDVAQTADALRQINDLVRGIGLPAVPESVIEGIINRNSLAVLGIE
jgi:uncharacterized protein